MDTTQIYLPASHEPKETALAERNPFPGVRPISAAGAALDLAPASLIMPRMKPKKWAMPAYVKESPPFFFSDSALSRLSASPI